ncbi:MAG TPA: methionine--tRNA ligase, partial [Stellaceae bacterium]|nr:methionine--tRNA ligase [Stellaceae bacterium]
AWQDRLLAWYEANPDAIAPRGRRNEVISFVRGGLKDLSISRTSFRWGIPVPGDPKHVVYVWLDALINYITALGYPDTQNPLFSTFWPAELHMVGKDILRFHTVYWHAFLLAAGIEPPRRVFAHGWWTVEGQKMSKSLGNFIPPQELVERYGVDPLRYFLLRELPFGSDGDFSHRAVVGRLNGDLANDLGNLAQRVLAMINRNCAAALPEPGAFAEADAALLAEAQGLLAKVRPLLEEQAFHLALETIWRVVGDANRYVDEQAPWVLRRSDPARMATVLYTLAEVLRHLGILVQPFVPAAAADLLDQLAVPAGARRFADLPQALPPGRALPAPHGIFPRFVETDAAERV